MLLTVGKMSNVKIHFLNFSEMFVFPNCTDKKISIIKNKIIYSILIHNYDIY